MRSVAYLGIYYCRTTHFVVYLMTINGGESLHMYTTELVQPANIGRIIYYVSNGRLNVICHLPQCCWSHCVSSLGHCGRQIYAGECVHTNILTNIYT